MPVCSNRPNQPSPRPAEPPRSSGRPGFALPLALLLVVVGGLFATAALARFSGQRRALERQLEAYRNHHISLGIQEAVSTWQGLAADNFEEFLLTERGQEYLDPRLGLTIELEDRSRVLVSFNDGQGRVLSDARGISQTQLPAAEAIYTELFDRAELRNLSRDEFAELTRPVGPSAISLRAADDLVLQALTDGLLSGGSADRTFGRLTALRDRDEPLTELDVQEALAEAGLDDEERSRIQPMLTVQPQLYFVTVEVEAAPPNRSIIARFGGYVEVGRSDPSSLEQGGRFLTWEELPLEPEGP